MSFIFFFIIFILFIGLFVILSILGFIRSIFGFGKHSNPTQQQHSDTFEQPNSKSKIFDKKEGEYVDYEEIKD